MGHSDVGSVSGEAGPEDSSICYEAPHEAAGVGLGIRLRGGLATMSDQTSPTGSHASINDLAPSPASAPGKYSRKDLDTRDVFWTCSLEEFRAMSDKQWASFGTAFYIAPAGFDTATKHVVQLE